MATLRICLLKTTICKEELAEIGHDLAKFVYVDMGGSIATIEPDGFSVRLTAGAGLHSDEDVLYGISDSVLEDVYVWLYIAYTDTRRDIVFAITFLHFATLCVVFFPYMSAENKHTFHLH